MPLSVRDTERNDELMQYHTTTDVITTIVFGYIRREIELINLFDKVGKWLKLPPNYLIMIMLNYYRIKDVFESEPEEEIEDPGDVEYDACAALVNHDGERINASGWFVIDPNKWINLTVRFEWELLFESKGSASSPFIIGLKDIKDATRGPRSHYNSSPATQEGPERGNLNAGCYVSVNGVNCDNIRVTLDLETGYGGLTQRGEMRVTLTRNKKSSSLGKFEVYEKFVGSRLERAFHLYLWAEKQANVKRTWTIKNFTKKRI